MGTDVENNAVITLWGNDYIGDAAGNTYSKEDYYQGAWRAPLDMHVLGCTGPSSEEYSAMSLEELSALPDSYSPESESYAYKLNRAEVSSSRISEIIDVLNQRQQHLDEGEQATVIVGAGSPLAALCRQKLDAALQAGN